MSSLQTHDKFAYVRGRTAVVALVIPPGLKGMILSESGRTFGGAGYLTGAGDLGVPTAAIDWTAAGSTQDKTLARSATAPWEGVSPQSLYEDSNLVYQTEYTVAANGGANLDNKAPLLCQRLASRVSLQLSTTYNGQAEIRTVTAGDSQSHVGRRQETHRFDVDSEAQVLSTAGHDPAMTGTFNTIHQAGTSESPYTLAERIGALHVVPGNQKAHWHVDATPDYSWRYWGRLDPTSAPDNGRSSQVFNFEPRDNMAFHAHKSGYTVVSNRSSTDSLTVYFRVKTVWAVVLQGDDGVRSISGLASLARLQAPRLIPHMPPTSDPRAFFPTQVGPSAGDLAALHAIHIGPAVAALHDERPSTAATITHIAPDGVQPATVREVASVSTWSRIKSVIQDVAGVAAAAMPVLEIGASFLAPEAAPEIIAGGSALQGLFQSVAATKRRTAAPRATAMANPYAAASSYTPSAMNAAGQYHNPYATPGVGRAATNPYM